MFEHFLIEFWVGTYGGKDLVLYSMPRRRVHSVGGNGNTDKAIVRHHVPIGAKAWRPSRDGEAWRPLSTLPADWLKGEKYG
jgi:hypothetical protein